ncbi:MAG: hypothetical protein GX605_12145, partial [Chloroflexi bacterium]|nr:hypothetical protein [Chloroflexota bacterium]
PNKIVGAYGDGGIVTTDDPDLAEEVRLWGSYGETRDFEQVGPVKLLAPMDHIVEGYHSHLDTLQAAVVLAKLPHVPAWIARRQAIAALYGELLADSNVVTPHVPAGFGHVYRNYVVLVANRHEVRRALARWGVETHVLYAPAVHLKALYRRLGYHPGDLPVTEEIAEQVLCLPIYPELTDEQIRYVADCLMEATQGSSLSLGAGPRAQRGS